MNLVCLSGIILLGSTENKISLGGEEEADFICLTLDSQFSVKLAQQISRKTYSVFEEQMDWNVKNLFC